jgi:hypothetical protein
MEVLPMKAIRGLYAVLVWLFVAGVVVQVFFAGMVVVARQMNWDYHRALGATLGLSTLLLLILVYLGRLPGRIKRFNWLLFVVLTVQVLALSLRDRVPFLSAFHPVLALAVFTVSLSLAWRTTTVLRSEKDWSMTQIQAES